MKAVEVARCRADEDDATATLLAEFRSWLVSGYGPTCTATYG